MTSTQINNTALPSSDLDSVRPGADISISTQELFGRATITPEELPSYSIQIQSQVDSSFYTPQVLLVPGGEKVLLRFTPPASGRYIVSATLPDNIIKQITIAVTLHNQPLPSSAQTQNAQVLLNDSLLFGKSLTEEEDAILAAGGCNISLKSPSGELVTGAKITKPQGRHGNYLLSFPPSSGGFHEREGVYKLSLTVPNTNRARTIGVQVSPANAPPPTITSELPQSLQHPKASAKQSFLTTVLARPMVGKPYHLFVHPRDSSGKILSPQALAGIQVQGWAWAVGEGESGPLKKKGLLQFEWIPVRKGRHQVIVQVNGDEVEGRDAGKYFFDAGLPPYSGTSDAIGEGLVSAKIGKPNRFQVLANDIEGDRVKSGGFKVEISVESPSEKITNVKVVDKTDGSFDVTYKLPESVEGESLTISVKIDGEAVQGSPFTVPVEELVAPANSLVDIHPLTEEDNTIYVEDLLELGVLARSKRGNVITGPARKPFTLSVKTPSNQELVFTCDSQKDEGLYTAPLTFPHTGEYTLQAYYGNDPIGSPIRVSAVHSPSPRHYLVSNEKGLSSPNPLQGGSSLANVFLAGENLEYDIEIRDSHGGKSVLTGQLELEADLFDVLDPSRVLHFYPTVLSSPAPGKYHVQISSIPAGKWRLELFQRTYTARSAVTGRRLTSRENEVDGEFALSFKSPAAGAKLVAACEKIGSTTVLQLIVGQRTLNLSKSEINVVDSRGDLIVESKLKAGKSFRLRVQGKNLREQSPLLPRPEISARVAGKEARVEVNESGVWVEGDLPETFTDQKADVEVVSAGQKLQRRLSVAGHILDV